MEKKDFNEAINGFIAWYVRKGIVEDISEEEFEKRLEGKKEEIIDKIEGFKGKVDLMSLMGCKSGENDGNEEFNPFVPLMLLMLFPAFNEYEGFIENLVGRKLSKEEFSEYMKLSSDKMYISNVIRFLEDDENEKINGDIMPNVLKNLLCIKDKVLPYFKNLETETKEKMDKFNRVNNEK